MTQSTPRPKHPTSARGRGGNFFFASGEFFLLSVAKVGPAGDAWRPPTVELRRGGLSDAFHRRFLPRLRTLTVLPPRAKIQKGTRGTKGSSNHKPLFRPARAPPKNTTVCHQRNAQGKGACYDERQNDLSRARKAHNGSRMEFLLVQPHRRPRCQEAGV